MKDHSNLKIFPLVETEYVKVHGRTTGERAPLSLFWTASGLEMNAKGSELWLEVESDYDVYEPWMSVLINSTTVSRQMLTAGRYWICIFRGMDPHTVKNVRVLKDVQAMNEDGNHSFQIHAIKFDGELLPVEDKPYKVEFIGDSITSGEGAIGAKQENDWIPMWFSAVRNYATMTAEALNADYRILSQSGWGVMTSWDNNPNCNIPDIYEKIAGSLKSEKNRALGALNENDFDAWQPDAVVVNLGTNDTGAFYNSEWKDAATGRVYKQRLNEDGSFNKDDLQAFEEAVESFLLKLRKNNKHAHIVWAYGMIGIPLMPSIYRAVDRYKEKTGDLKVSVFQLPNTTEETIGSRAHPGVLAHEKSAKELTGYLKEILGVQ